MGTLTEKELIVVGNKLTDLDETESLVSDEGELDSLVVEDPEPSDILSSDIPRPSTFNDNEYGHFQYLGKYIFIFLIIYEFQLLFLMGNITFLIYGAAMPKIVSCGSHTINQTMSDFGCGQFMELQRRTSCLPQVEAQFESLQFEFMEYCDNATFIKQWGTSFQMLGMMIGSTFAGQWSDAHGRVKILKWCITLMFIFNFISSFATGSKMFIAIRFFGSIAIGGNAAVMHVLLLEYLPKNHRVWLSTIFSFSPNFIIFAGIAWYASNWRFLMQIVGAIGVMCLIMMQYIREPVRWLVQKGRLDDARESMYYIDSLSDKLDHDRKKDIDEYIALEGLKRNRVETRKKKCGYTHLFITAKYASYSLFFAYSALVGCFINYAIIFNLEKLSGSIYMNNVYLGLIRWFFNAFVGGLDFFVDKFGRLACHSMAMLTIISSLGIVLIDIFVPFASPMIGRISTLVALSMCSQIFVSNSISITELYPTSIRNIAVSFQAAFARIGSIVSPFLFSLSPVWIGLPYAVMVVMSVVDLIGLFAIVPETKGNPLKDHLPDKSEWMFGSKHKELKALALLEKNAVVAPVGTDADGEDEADRGKTTRACDRVV
uniref:MFS domain-containing protein n=1 Tax=Rhabditophanes sp. KR3021 TaxID=114890 RepID=A0AC35U4E3_9BILA